VNKVCFFHNPHTAGLFHGSEFGTLDSAPYFLKNLPRLRPRRENQRLRALFSAKGVDPLYQERDPAYM
jgi:hypothetical protein